MTINLNFTGRVSCANFIPLMIDLIVLKVYSIFSFSKIRSLFCVSILTDAQVLIMISSAFTFLVILTSPKGITIDFLPGSVNCVFRGFPLASNSKLF